MALSRDEKLVAYEALIEAVPDIELKGKKTRYTSMNGNMFSFLSPEGQLAVRLPRDERADFLARFPDATVVQYDTLMKDYIEVPEALIENERALRELFDRSVANALVLRPKPTKRRKKKDA